LDRRALNAFNSNQILLVGTGDRVATVKDALERQRSWGHQVAGFLNVDGQHGAESLNIPVLGNLKDFDRVLDEHQIDEVIFAIPRNVQVSLDMYLQKCEKTGVSFRIVPGLYDTGQNTLRVETLQGIPTLAAHSGSATASGLLYKRILDLVAGLVGFLICLVFYPIIALAIKLDSPGPVLFKQCRIGKNNRQFCLYKFRTMVADADSMKKELLKQSEMSGPMFKMEDDPRITRVGKFLRKTSLDEFPQFVNVLKGEMSLVGTRPPTPDEVEQYHDEHRRRISIKPGITGLWQISGRNEVTEFSEVVKLDLNYIDSWRFMKDLQILWKTLWVVLARKGAR
jgi:exopolysaccharide biosynthesis polyprenyl glycosylphosphotransferase